MLNKTIDRQQLWMFSAYGFISLVAIFCGVILRKYAFYSVPLLLIFGYITLIDFKKIFYVLLFVLPLSTEVYLGSFGTDFPSEQLMVTLMCSFILFIIVKPKSLSFKFLKHPIVLLLLVHFLWMAFIIFFSKNKVVSTKFLLAKTWYIITFVFVAGMIVNSKTEMKKFFWLIFIPMTFTIVVILLRFALLHFDFEFVNDPMAPFYRNHVNYAAMITMFFPFIFLATGWYRPGSWTRILLQCSKVLYLIAITLSYTRACQLGIVIAAACYVLMQFRLLTWAFRFALVGVLAGVFYLSINNNYLKLAPDYTDTIYHSDFGQHLKATVELNDVSSMERVYRWVAAFRMIPEKPWFGYGTNNFYPWYQRYTVSDFVTYTSDNEERSTVHDYFLLTAIEQGIPGLLLFLFLSLAIFHYGEKGYTTEKDPERKRTIMVVVLSLVIMYVNLSLNDLVEVDKTGSLYFMDIAILVNLLIGNYDTSDKEAVKA